MENFKNLCASSSSSSCKNSRLNIAIVSSLLASICFLSLRFSPSFFSLLLLIPSLLFLANRKSDSNQISYRNDHHLFDENPQTTAEQQSAATAVAAAKIEEEEVSSDEEGSSSNGETGDFDSDLWMYCLDELARNLPFSEDDSSSEDDDSLIEIPLLPNSKAAIPTDSIANRGAIRNLERCLPDLLPETVLKQRGFVELFEEINEEDNLIEIDICTSRGFNRFSTVCS